MIYTNYTGNKNTLRKMLKQNDVPCEKDEEILTVGYLDTDITLDANGYSKIQFAPTDTVVLVRGFTLEMTLLVLTCFGQFCPVYILFEKDGKLIPLSTPLYKILSDGALWPLLSRLIAILKEQLKRDNSYILTISIYEELQQLDEEIRKAQTKTSSEILDKTFGKA